MGELTCLALFLLFAKKGLKTENRPRGLLMLTWEITPPPSIFFKLYNQKWPEHFLFLSIL